MLVISYFFGFFKNKRIVLYDTLLKQVPDTEGILAIVGVYFSVSVVYHTCSIHWLFVCDVYMCLSLGFVWFNLV